MKAFVHHTCLLATLYCGLVATDAAAVNPRTVTTEPITEVQSFPGNTATVWGYHQSIIVNTGGTLFCALLEPWGEVFAQQWSLYERMNGDGWRRVWSSPREQELNQPPSLLSDNDGTLHVFAWPDGVFTRYRFAAGDDEPVIDNPESPYDDLWPYAGASVSGESRVLVVASPYPRSTFAISNLDGWRAGLVSEHPEVSESPSGFDRQAYPFVVLSGQAAHVFTTSDIADPDKIEAGADFVYSFRNLQYFYTPDITSVPFVRTEIANVERTGGKVHNDDLLLTRNGEEIHLLYRARAVEDDFRNDRCMHAFGPPGGRLTHVQLGELGEFGLGRLWESPGGTVYAVLPRHTDVQVAPLDADGDLARAPVSLGIRSDGWFNDGRLFLTADRGSTTAAEALEGLYFVRTPDDMNEVRYFRVLLDEQVPLDRLVTADPSDLWMQPPFPNPFNSSASICFSLADQGLAQLDVINLAGQHVSTLLDDHLSAGIHETTWGGVDDDGRIVAAGVYLLRLKTRGQRLLQRMVHLK